MDNVLLNYMMENVKYIAQIKCMLYNKIDKIYRRRVAKPRKHDSCLSFKIATAHQLLHHIKKT